MSRSEIITAYRVQDRYGRGPFKPGFSHNWVEPREDHENLLPWMKEFPDIELRGTHLGSACRTVEQLRRWFTLPEYAKLIRYGYTAYAIGGCEIIEEGPTQLVINRDIPFRIGAVSIELY